MENSITVDLDPFETIQGKLTSRDGRGDLGCAGFNATAVGSEESNRSGLPPQNAAPVLILPLLLGQFCETAIYVVGSQGSPGRCESICSRMTTRDQIGHHPCHGREGN